MAGSVAENGRRQLNPARWQPLDKSIIGLPKMWVPRKLNYKLLLHSEVNLSTVSGRFDEIQMPLIAFPRRRPLKWTRCRRKVQFPCIPEHPVEKGSLTSGSATSFQIKRSSRRKRNRINSAAVEFRDR